MSTYYKTFLNALTEASAIERRTDLASGNEAIFRNGIRLAETGPMDRYDITEEIKAEPHLVLFGCGHVGKALYDLAVLQGMKTTVLDCREELLTEERFPKAERICAPYEKLLNRDYQRFISPYFCIFTHGHTYDEDCLLYALEQNHSYIGMIGSRAKVAHCLNSIKSKGITEKQLSKLHSPIGLSINAVTPEEIAISIMAQIISVFRESRQVITIDPKVIRKASNTSGIMARIVEKSGSAPRGIGSAIFVTEHDFLGTVGGGAIEEHTINRARMMLRNNETYLLEKHALTGKEPLEMTCGGNTTVLFTKVN